MKSSKFKMPVGVKSDLFPEVSKEDFSKSIDRMNKDFQKDLDELGLNGAGIIAEDTGFSCDKDSCPYKVNQSRVEHISSHFNGYTKDNPLFYSSSAISDLETIYFDMVLVGYLWSMLFTCVNKLRTHLYICCCYHADGDGAHWLVQRTTAQDVIFLLEDKITINEIFTSSDTIYKLDLFSGSSIVAKEYKINELPSSIFPTPGYTMDVEDGEFDDEIRELKGERYSGVQLI